MSFILKNELSEMSNNLYTYVYTLNLIKYKPLKNIHHNYLL